MRSRRSRQRCKDQRRLEGTRVAPPIGRDCIRQPSKRALTSVEQTDFFYIYILPIYRHQLTCSLIHHAQPPLKYSSFSRPCLGLNEMLLSVREFEKGGGTDRVFTTTRYLGSSLGDSPVETFPVPVLECSPYTKHLCQPTHPPFR